jgi:hypothetical protein
MDCPSFFKESLVSDFSKLEGHLEHIKIMYGVDLEVTAKPVEKPEGRWLGRGIVEDMASIADLYKKK